jgi:pimeloyl-ACP methyl ester carboxylesterase
MGIVRARHRVWMIGLAGAVAILLTGALYQFLSVRHESSRFPPPGRLIDVRVPGEPAARRLHLVCVGNGQPTVIFEHSGLGGALSSRAAREEVSAYTRTCSYDRVGMGWSDPGPEIITAGLLADDLERLTQQAGLPPPFILVPASLGGVVAELFARRHREQVAGLVFVDAGNSAIWEAAAAQLNWMEVESACLLRTAARFGVLRLADPLGLRKENAGSAAQTMARLYREEPAATVCGIARGVRMSQREFDAAPPLAPDIPLTVLVHQRPDGLFPAVLAGYGKRVERQWLKMQQDFALRSRHGTWRRVPGSDHLIGNSQPHAVAAAVLEMVSDVRRTH